MSACKYENIATATYPQQILYMPTARNGLFLINSVPTPGIAFRYTVNLTEKRFVIPLGVFRGGVTNEGTIPVNIAVNTDTVSRLISSSALVGTALIPADKYTLPPSVTIQDRTDSAPFELKIDLDFLRNANPAQRLAIAVGIASPQTLVNQALKTTVISIDPAIFKPVPNFTSRVPTAATPRLIAFTNTSQFGVSYSWDFGDGSAPVTDLSPTYTYPRAGTFTVTLTATGITGAADAARRTATVTVL